MAAPAKIIHVLNESAFKVTKLKVKKGQRISKGTIFCLYTTDDNVVQKFKSNHEGIVSEICVKEGQELQAGCVLFSVEGCNHPTVMKDMCAECGADLRVENSTAGNRKEDVKASVAMVHSIPELIVSEEQAKELGKEDEGRLLKTRKLVLLVDLDQTLIHTTNDNIPANLKDVNHFPMWHGNQLLWYHTRLRPRTQHFLENISKMYELHICTFGVRMYAHTIAKILDPEGKYFSHRILSRDECFNASSKTANLKALFPCGDSMVCIIDDREDVWNFSPNLIHVKPYRFFQGTADINAPPGLTKMEQDDKPIVHRVRRVSQSSTGSNENEENNKNEIKDNNEMEITVESNKTEGVKCETTDKAKTGVKESIKEAKNDGENTECLDKKIVTDSEKMEINQTASEPDKDGVEMKTINVKNEKEDKETTENEKKNQVAENKNGEKEESQQEKKNSSYNKNTDKDSQGNKSNEIENDQTKIDEKLKTEDKDNDKNVDENEYIEWDDEDDYLFYLEEILTKIHSVFYDMHDSFKEKETTEKEKVKPNMKNIIPYIKKKVLKGCNLVFSGVIPTNMVAEKSRACIVAKALGANVQQELMTKQNEKDPQKITTHLVAARLGTTKVRTALKYKKIKIVNVDWLWSCSERWELVEESLFPLLKESDTPGRDSPDITEINFKRKRENNENSNRTEKRSKIDGMNNNAPVVDESDSNKAVIDKNEKDDVKEEKRTKSSKSGTKSSSKGKKSAGAVSSRQDRFSLTYNPLFAFSDDDLAYMDKEVEDEMDDENASDEEDEDREERVRKQVLKTNKHEHDSSSEESLNAELPRGWGLRKKMSPKSSSSDEESLTKSPKAADDAVGPEYESETDQDKFEKIMDAFGPITDNSDDEEYAESIGSVDDELAEAVEKEFLS